MEKSKIKWSMNKRFHKECFKCFCYGVIASIVVKLVGVLVRWLLPL